MSDTKAFREGERPRGLWQFEGLEKFAIARILAGAVGQYHRAIMVKSEIRSPKSETNPNSQPDNAQNQQAQWRFELWIFPVGACFGFRASDFGGRRLVVLANSTRC